MPTRSEAEEHLRIIRSLMEKATIYRAISAEASAVGGVLAIAASFAFGNWWDSYSEGGWLQSTGSNLVALWLSVLAITALANVVFLWRDARRRGDQFVSSGMRLAIRALLPSYLVAAFCTWFIGFNIYPNMTVAAWIICHGLALLATGHFAPRSLNFLGWAFLLAGLVSVLPLAGANWPTISGLGIATDEHLDQIRQRHALLIGQRWMAWIFGLFHLIYAACTWPRRVRGAQGGAQP